MTLNFVTIEQVRNPHIEKIYSILYMACITVAGLGDWKFLGGYAMYLKVFSLGGFGLAVLRMLWKSEYKRLGLLGQMLIVYVIPLAFVYFLSMALWSTKTMDTSYISRGTQKIMFQFITVAVVMGGAYLFGAEIIDYTFYGLAAANATILLVEMARFGIVGAITSMVQSIITLNNSRGFLRRMEIHDITFCMGIFMLFYVFDSRNIKWRIPRIAVSGFLFLIGLKRIAMLAIATAMGIQWFLTRRKPRNAFKMVTIVQCLVVGLSFLYVYIISIGLWTEIMLKLGADTAGRDKIYEYINQFYSLDPTYMGYGFEYTVAMLRGMRDSGNQVIHVTGVHCDILKQYIELGFWGYLIWMLYTFVFQGIFYYRRFGVKPMILFFTIGLYAWVTYMTDNTIYYFWLSMVLKIVVLSSIIRAYDEKNSGSHKNPKKFRIQDLSQ